MKVISLGLLCNGKKSYLINTWNRLDFTIVLVALVSLVFNGYNFSFLKSLRLLRILRPLRMISRVEGLKLAVTSLINSMPSIIKLFFIIAFFMFLMAILGTTLFNG
jgi:membrane-anchored protein YejM (alkaline phosphatase superfamily)